MLLLLAWFMVALHDYSAHAAEALDYCLGSLLWSAFFFMLGYLAATVVQAARDHLGRARDDHT